MSRTLTLAVTLLLAVAGIQTSTAQSRLKNLAAAKVKALEGDGESCYELSKYYEDEYEYLLALIWHNMAVKSGHAISIGVNNMRSSRLSLLADSDVPRLGALIRTKGYDSLDDFDNGYAIVGKGGRYGIIERLSASETVPCTYDSLHSTGNKGVFAAMKGDKWGIIKYDGAVITNFEYDEVHEYNEKGYCVVDKGGKIGCVDSYGKLIVPCRYDYPQDYYNDDGDEEKWSTPFYFIEGKARVYRDYKYGFVDLEGNEVVPCIYDQTYWFSGGVAKVSTLDGYGLVDSKGKELLPCNYYSIGDFADGLAFAMKDGKYDYINRQGKVSIALGYSFKKYEDVELIIDLARHPETFHDGVALVYDDKLGHILIDKQGNRLTKNKYSLIYPFHNGLALACRDGKWGSIDLKGNEVEPCVHDYHVRCNDLLGVYPQFIDNLVEIERDGKHGMADNAGREVMPCEDNRVVLDTWNGLRIVSDNNSYKYGVVDKDNNVVIPLEWKRIYTPMFNNDVCTALTAYSESGDTVYFNSKCQRLNGAPLDFEQYARLQELNGKLGYVGVDGLELAPCVYTFPYAYPEYREGLSIVEKDGRKGYITRFGKCTLDY
jgi:hypothetical protein